MLASCVLVLLALGAHSFMLPHGKHNDVQNVVEDALRQSGHKLRCFVQDKDGRVHLSEPKYILCSYMIDPKDGSPIVTGIDSEDQDYEDTLNMMNSNESPRNAMLQVCITEAFQFHAPSNPSQVATRCLCRRSGCNLPKSIGELIAYQSYVLPEVSA